MSTPERVNLRLLAVGCWPRCGEPGLQAAAPIGIIDGESCPTPFSSDNSRAFHWLSFAARRSRPNCHAWCPSAAASSGTRSARSRYGAAGMSRSTGTVRSGSRWVWSCRRRLWKPATLFARPLQQGTVASVTHLGPYGGLGAAHQAIHDWCRANNHRTAGPSWEIYGHWKDEWNADPSQIRTDVFYLVAPA